MASSDRPDDDLKPRRRGKAPTITLEAQEIAATAETETPATATAQGPAEAARETGENSQTGAATPSPGDDAPPDHAAEPRPEDHSAADAPAEGPIPLVTGGIEPGPVPPATEEPPAAEPPPVTEPPPAEAPPPASPPPPREAAAAGPGFGRLVAAGLVGALLTGGLAAGAQMAGYWPGASRQDTGALEQRIAALDAQIRQVATRPATPAAGPAVDLAPVTRRIEALDQARATLESRLAALEQRPAPTEGGGATSTAPTVDMAPIRTEIDALKAAVEAVAAAQRSRPATPPAPAADMADVDQRIAAAVSPQSNRIAEIAGSVQMLQAEVKAGAAALAAAAEKVAALESARTEQGDAGRRAARVVGIGALRAAIDRGQPFAAELKAAQALGLPAPATDALQPHAERGLPTTGALAQRFSALAPALMRAAPGPAAEGTLLERITASAQSLVRIRPVGEAAGDDVPTVIARVEAKLRRGDLAGGLADFDRLPEPVRALGADWAAEARARAAAETTLRRLSAEAAGALSGG